MERQYKKTVGKQVDLFINYELHEHNITNYSNDFDIFVGSKKTKKIFEQIIKIINSPHDSLNTIKLKNIILNHDLFISIGIINTIRPKSVFIKILDKQKLKLKHIVIFMNSYIESAILLKTLDTNRYFIPLCLPVKKRDENKYLLDIEYDCRGTFMYKYPDVITVLRKYYNNTVTSSNIFGYRQNMHTANYIDFIFSLLRLSKEITKIDNDNIISYASCLTPTN